MSDIELLKQKLNAEKVFYNLNWHELVLDQSSNDSQYERSNHQTSEVISNGENNHSINPYVKNNKKNPELHKAVSDTSDNNSNIDGYFENARGASPKHDMRTTSEKKNYMDPNATLDNNRCCLFSRDCWISSTFCSVLKKCFNCKPGCCIEEQGGHIYIEEIKNKTIEASIDFKPLVDIFYNAEKLVLCFFVSGKIENLIIDFNSLTNELTVSGTKLPYENFTEQYFVSHEINEGYFMRIYRIKKKVMEKAISYSHENGIIKILIPFKLEE